MLTINLEKSFKKDISRDKKCGKYSQNDFEILKIIIKKLELEEEIDSIYKRHNLKGEMKDFEAIHLENDWILIFKIIDNDLFLNMLGTHSQVYKKFK